MAKAYYTAEGSEIHLTCYPYPTGSTAVYEVAPSNAHDTKWRSPETWDTILWEKDSERADDGEPRSSQDTEEIASSPKKPLSFWLAFLSLSIISLVVAMDATSLAVAVPVKDFARSPAFLRRCLSLRSCQADQSVFNAG